MVHKVFGRRGDEMVLDSMEFRRVSAAAKRDSRVWGTETGRLRE